MNIYAYIDERGSFTVPGFHAVACVGTTEPFVDFDLAAEKLFEGLGIDFDLFHATATEMADRLELANAAATLLTTRKAVAMIGQFDLAKAPPADTWGPAVLETLVRTVKSLKTGTDPNLVVHLCVEQRRSFNLLPFERVATERLKALNLGPSVQMRLCILPKGMSAGMQLADLLANLAGHEGALPGYAQTFEITDETLLSKFAAKFTSSLFAEPEAVLRVPLVTRVTSPTLPVNHVERAQQALHVALQTHRDGFDGYNAPRESSLPAPPSTPTERCALALALLTDARGRLAQHDALGAAWLTLYILQELDPQPAIQLEAAAIWLHANNHLGHVLRSHPLIQAAQAVAEAHLERVDLEAALTYFVNVVAVSHQNAWDFDSARDVLTTLLAPLEGRRDLRGQPARAEHIGAFLGTYATTCMLAAGFSCFTQPTSDLFEQLHEEGLLYSSIAQTTFAQPADAERHRVYQAHAHMQRALLLGDETSLAEAEQLLTAREEPSLRAWAQQLMSDGLAAAGPDTIYRLAAALKLFWLQRWNALEGLPAKNARRTIKGLTGQHPAEQILGYLALTPHSQPQTDALHRLQQTRWTSGLVDAIARVFLLQQQYEHEGALASDEQLQALAVSLGTTTIHAWKSSKRFALLEHGAKTAAWRGPLSVLPFNYG